MNNQMDHFDPLDYSLYIHIPFCRQKCRYCAFYSLPGRQSDLPRFLRALPAELEMRRLTAPARTVYIGGGSPSVLSGRDMVVLVESIRRIIDPAGEFTVEVNPAQADLDFLKVLRSLGANRLSIGAQSFLPHELEFLGRIHRAEDITAALTRARRAGFENISLDLIFAIPGSTVESWKVSLEQAIQLQPEHISAYSLSYEEGTPLHRDLMAGSITPVDEETDRAMYETAIDTLQTAGYEQVEISNFASPGFACLHNVRCWQNLPYVGLGPSAASWYNGQRTENIADIGAYLDRVEQGQSPTSEIHTPIADEIACETAVLNLRMRQGISRSAFLRQTGHDPATLFADAIKKNLETGLLEITPDSIRLTPQALPIADSVLADFSTPPA